MLLLFSCFHNHSFAHRRIFFFKQNTKEKERKATCKQQQQQQQKLIIGGHLKWRLLKCISVISMIPNTHCVCVYILWHCSIITLCIVVVYISFRSMRVREEKKRNAHTVCIVETEVKYEGTLCVTHSAHTQHLLIENSVKSEWPIMMKLYKQANKAHKFRID